MKSKNERDAKYLSLIKGKPCIALRCSVSNRPGQDGLIAYHHVRELGGGGTGLKPSDYDCVPLCDYHHKLWHQKGMFALNLDMEYILKAINRYLIEYILQSQQEASK